MRTFHFWTRDVKEANGLDMSEGTTCNLLWTVKYVCGSSFILLAKSTTVNVLYYKVYVASKCLHSRRLDIPFVSEGAFVCYQSKRCLFRSLLLLNVTSSDLILHNAKCNRRFHCFDHLKFQNVYSEAHLLRSKISCHSDT